MSKEDPSSKKRHRPAADAFLRATESESEWGGATCVIPHPDPYQAAPLYSRSSTLVPLCMVAHHSLVEVTRLSHSVTAESAGTGLAATRRP